MDREENRLCSFYKLLLLFRFGVESITTITVATAATAVKTMMTAVKKMEITPASVVFCIIVSPKKKMCVIVKKSVFFVDQFCSFKIWFNNNLLTN